ncbi:MAG: hypothetical protein RLZZ165_1266 [Bacteroidota bacterium]|jgi:hypothetical protein
MAKLNSTEQKLLQEIEDWKAKGPGFLNAATHLATKPLRWAAEKLIPGDIQDKMGNVGERIAEKLQDASQWTVREEEVLQATKEFEIDSTTILELQNASVFDLNHVAEEFVKFNTRLAAAEGFGTGLLGWAGLLADLPALFILNFRMLYQISLSFGYKVEATSEGGEEPFEIGYMLRIFKIATASSGDAKTAALAELRQFEDDHPDGIARVGSDFTRKQIGKNAAINISRIIINQIVKETLARKAVTSIPGIGAILTAGFNYYYVQDVGRTAIMIYQERFLLDKKGRKRVVTIDVE